MGLVGMVMRLCLATGLTCCGVTAPDSTAFGSTINGVVAPVGRTKGRRTWRLRIATERVAMDAKNCMKPVHPRGNPAR